MRVREWQRPAAEAGVERGDEDGEDRLGRTANWPTGRLHRERDNREPPDERENRPDDEREAGAGVASTEREHDNSGSAVGQCCS